MQLNAFLSNRSRVDEQNMLMHQKNRLEDVYMQNKKSIDDERIQKEKGIEGRYIQNKKDNTATKLGIMQGMSCIQPLFVWY